MAKLPIPFGNPATYPGHSGVDFAKPQGTIFRASGPGRVRNLGQNSRGGFYIWVEYDGYPAVGYHHMPNHNGCPPAGTRVNLGTPLGHVGSTGNSTGPHLHSEVEGRATTDGYWSVFDRNSVVGGGSSASFDGDVKARQEWLISRNYDLGPTGADGIAGPLYEAAVKKYQTFLRAYGYTGDIDGDWGPATELAHKAYVANANAADATLQAEQAWLISRGYDLGPSGADGVWGPKTEAAIKAYQEFLRKYGYTGDIDGQWGPGTQSAHEKYYAEVTAPPPSTGAPAFPLPAHQWFGPESGGENSISGYYSHTEDVKTFQQRLRDRGYPVTVDGQYGPKGATTPQGNTAENVVAFQKFANLVPDGLVGPTTWGSLWTVPITPTVPTPEPPNPTEPTTPTVPSDEEAATPKLFTPVPADFPAWIRFEAVLDPEGQAPDHNKNAAEYYGVPYSPVESHLHWWGAPGQAGTHDGNVSHLKNTKDLSVNFVVSEKRITLMVPINKIALTTGRRNPYAWKSENDPTLSDWQYKTMGYLHYIVEKLNPVLLNEPLRHHKEFYATSCSEINKAKVREYAEAFRTGALDPSTGLPPVVTPPVEPPIEPDPDKVEITKGLYDIIVGLPAELRSLASDIEAEL